jgi:hypothetical protein
MKLVIFVKNRLQYSGTRKTICGIVQIPIWIMHMQKPLDSPELSEHESLLILSASQ